MQSGKKDEPEPDVVLHHSGWDHLDVGKPGDTVNYALTGYESQVITIQLADGDFCVGEPGTMMYLSSGIKQSISCDSCLGRLCSGEKDCCVVTFTNSRSNSGGGAAYVALTPNFPTAKVIPIDLSSPDVGGTLICQKGAFMASHGDVSVGISLDCNLIRCCCSGLGLVRQKLVGDGTAFLGGTGTIVQKTLKEGETILVDTNCIMAYSNTCKLDLRRAGGILGMFGGGEGIFNTTLTGPGLVVVQSMNENMFRESLAADKLWRR